MNEKFIFEVMDMHEREFKFQIDVEIENGYIHMNNTHSFKIGSEEHLDLIKAFENVSRMLRHAAFKHDEASYRLESQVKIENAGAV